MSSEQSLYSYVKAFQTLNTDRSSSRWDATTRHRAPHKPILLLSVIDRIAEGSIVNNFIELTPNLGELFNLYWSHVRPMGRKRGNIAMPFFHLRSDGFWHLQPRPGQEDFLRRVPRIHAMSVLLETVSGVQLDVALYEALCTSEGREALRHALITTYFLLEIQKKIQYQGLTNIQAARYGSELLERAHKSLGETTPATEEDPAVRDQGFRRAIVGAYDHRCALCGVRILTAEGHSVIVAGHIIPWRISHDDDPRNGLALCHLCHWTFDEGLVALSPQYRIITSPQLMSGENVPGHLITLDGRGFIGPTEDVLWPFIPNLKWHRENVFRHR